MRADEDADGCARSRGWRGKGGAKSGVLGRFAALLFEVEVLTAVPSSLRGICALTQSLHGAVPKGHGWDSCGEGCAICRQRLLMFFCGTESRFAFMVGVAYHREHCGLSDFDFALERFGTIRSSWRQ